MTNGLTAICCIIVFVVCFWYFKAPTEKCLTEKELERKYLLKIDSLLNEAQKKIELWQK